MKNATNSRWINYWRPTENDNKTPLNLQFQKILKWLYISILHGFLYTGFFIWFIVSIFEMLYLDRHEALLPWLPMVIVSICCVWIISGSGAFIFLYIRRLVWMLPIQQIYKMKIINMTQLMYFLMSYLFLFLY